MIKKLPLKECEGLLATLMVKLHSVMVWVIDIFMELLNLILGNGTRLGTLLLGIAAITAMFRGKTWFEASKLSVAERTITLHEQEYHRKLKFDMALQAIDLFNRLKNDFDIIRQPSLFKGETKELDNLEESNILVKKAKENKSVGIVLMRLDKIAESVAEAKSLRSKFRALFGDDRPFAAVVNIHNNIWRSTYMLLNSSSSEKDGRHQDIIWKINDEDSLSQDMIQAVQRVEELCIPVLRGESKALPDKLLVSNIKY